MSEEETAPRCPTPNHGTMKVIPFFGSPGLYLQSMYDDYYCDVCYTSVRIMKEEIENYLVNNNIYHGLT